MAALIELILPRATVVTPNLLEARVLAGDAGEMDGEELARAVHALGPERSSSPAGIASQATDLLFDGATLTELPGERHPDGAAHGSGCTHSSTLAARLALGDPLPEAARRARAAAGRRGPRRPARPRRRCRARRRHRPRGASTR